MPTHAERERFLREYSRLTREQRKAFLAAVGLFVAGLGTQRFDQKLRIKRVQGQRGVWELTWAPDGRATFEYGTRSARATRTSSGGVSGRTTSFASRKRGTVAPISPTGYLGARSCSSRWLLRNSRPASLEGNFVKANGRPRWP